MKLAFLLNHTDVINQIKPNDLTIEKICYDSRMVEKNSLFVCIDGIDEDGHQYLDDAIEKGAIAAVVTKDVGNRPIALIQVTDARLALAQLSAVFYQEPSRKMNVIGITGTKGKTTISYMIQSIYQAKQKPIGISGTLGRVLGEEKEKTQTTTPQSLDLQQFFYRCLQNQIYDVAMEVSSIALKQKRVECTHFSIGMFTNISRAHIGQREHTDFDDYVASKSMLMGKCETALINMDDGYGSHFKDQVTGKCFTISINDQDSDITAKEISTQKEGVSFVYQGLGHEFAIQSKMPGMFNVYNALFAVSAALLSGLDEKSIQEGLKNVLVPGRCETVYQNDHTIMIDYAHTPDSLEKLLINMKQSQVRLVCVFGCGGDRDHTMRPMMGEISGKHADLTIITSDNPRTEDPDSIIQMIEEGMKKTNGEYICVTDRTQAIRYAMEHAKPNDLIVLAGKGHETYIERNGKRTHYDEREVIQDIQKQMEESRNGST